MSPFDIIKVINEKSLTEDNKAEIYADYNAWIINHALSNMKDTLFFAAEMAQYPHVAKEIQFQFYYLGIPKGKRFGKWHKEDETEDELINKLCMGLKVNRTVAKRYLALLSEKQKREILSIEGGK